MNNISYSIEKQIPIVSIFCFITSAIIIWWWKYFDDVTISKEESLFIVLTFSLCIYLFIEIQRIIQQNRGQWILNPVVMASFLTFGLSFAFSNFIFIIDKNLSIYYFLSSTSYYWMNMAMTYVFLAVFAMWRGYHSIFGRNISKKLWVSSFFKRVLRKEFDLRWPFIIICIIIIFLSRILKINLGIFGYSSETKQLFALADFTQYLALTDSLAKILLVGIALAYFSGKYHHLSALRILLVAMTGIEIVVGFLLGFKSAVIFPIITVGVCYYICKRKVPKKMVLATLILLILSYLIIEPFRIERYSNPNFQTRNLGSIMSAMAPQDVDNSMYNLHNQMIVFAKRMNLTQESALAIHYAQRVGLSENSPKFLTNILLSPIYAYIPRIIWKSKPLGNIGYWFNVEVRGAPWETKSSVAMSPIGYLYFSGGGLCVFIFFFIIGNIQRIIYERFWTQDSGCLIVYLGVLSNLSLINSAVDGLFITLFRNIPLLLLFQYLLYKR